MTIQYLSIDKTVVYNMAIARRLSYLAKLAIEPLMHLVTFYGQILLVKTLLYKTVAFIMYSYFQFNIFST